MIPPAAGQHSGLAGGARETRCSANAYSEQVDDAHLILTIVYLVILELRDFQVAHVASSERHDSRLTKSRFRTVTNNGGLVMISGLRESYDKD